MSLKLNDEQRKLVEQNHNLIYSAMRDFGIKKNEFDDYYGIAAIGLCKAVIYFNADKGSISTIAYSCITNELKKELKKENRLMRKINKETISYNVSFTENHNDFANNCLLVDENFEKNFILLFHIRDAWNTIKKRHKDIFKLYLQGYQYLEIGNMYGISRQRVSTIIVGVKKKLENSIKDNYILNKRKREMHK